MAQGYLIKPGGTSEPGVGIESIEQTTTSTESGGENVMTVIREDGVIAGTFSVFNGAQGGIGPAGRDGYDVHDAQIYSTEETVIGQWVDGKPIYRAVIYTTSASTTGINASLIYTLTDRNIDEIVSYGGSILGITTSTAINIPLNCYDGSAFYVYTSFHPTSIYNAVGASSCVSRPMRITLEYTKTTDEATIAIATVAELDAAYNEGVQAA